MVILRSSGGGGAEPVATTPKRFVVVELDASSEFLSLLPAAQRKSSRRTRSSQALEDSFSSVESNTPNVSIGTEAAGPTAAAPFSL